MGIMSTNSSDLGADYLTLLVNQLQYQDPLDPVSNTEMTSQLAQISQLEQMEKLNSFSEELVAATERAEASELIGRQIAYLPTGSDMPVMATVEGVDFSSGSIMLVTEGQSVAMDQVMGITNG